MPDNNLDKFKKIIDKMPSDKRKQLYTRLHDMPASQREGFINEFVKRHDARQNQKPDKKKPVAGNVPQNKKASSQKKKGQPQKQAPSKSANPAPKGQQPKPEQPKKQSQPHNQGQPRKDIPVNNQKKHNKPSAQYKKPEKPIKKETINIDDLSYEESLNVELPPEKDTAPKEPAEPKNPYMSVIVGLLAALLIIGFFYFIYIFNKQKIDSKFNEMFGMPPSDTFSTVVGTDDIVGPAPTFPDEDPTPTPPLVTATPTPVQLKADHPNLAGKVIVIDPGHQAEPNTELEVAIPKTSAEKEKATTGGVGVDTGAKEYEITLKYALVLKAYLEGCGAKVILTRETNDANISNIERATVAISNKADYFIRLHADCIENSNQKGVKVYVPDSGKYTSTSAKDGQKLAEAIASGIGSVSLGSVKTKMFTGLNYADSIKSYQIVLGYISNSEDDALIAKEDTPYKVAVAISEFVAK